MVATVKMADGSDYRVTKLLADGDSNAKLSKSNASGKGYLTVSLSLSPANESGYQTCASSSAGCRKACLFTAGHGRMESVKRARIAKTILFFTQRETFLQMLVSELRSWERKAEKAGKHLAVRLNVVSDLAWEKLCPELFTLFPNVQFYDYTKHVRRALTYSVAVKTGDNSFPHNYHLTFSRSESNDTDVYFLLKNDCPINVAVVFDSKQLPEWWDGRKVINGDETDLRFLDDAGVIVGLYAKGEGKKDTSGFIVQTGLQLLKR